MTVRDLAPAARRLLEGRCFPGGAPARSMRRKSDYVPTAKPTTSSPTLRSRLTTRPRQVRVGSCQKAASSSPTRSRCRLCPRRRPSPPLSPQRLRTNDCALSPAATANNETSRPTHGRRCRGRARAHQGAYGGAAPRRRCFLQWIERRCRRGHAGWRARRRRTPAGGRGLRVYRRRTLSRREEERSPRNSPRIDVEEGAATKARSRRGRSSLNVGRRAAAAALHAFVGVFDLCACFRSARAEQKARNTERWHAAGNVAGMASRAAPHEEGREDARARYHLIPRSRHSLRASPRSSILRRRCASKRCEELTRGVGCHLNLQSVQDKLTVVQGDRGARRDMRLFLRPMLDTVCCRR